MHPDMAYENNDNDKIAIIPTLISRTALDSLNAKLSAIDGGWLDGRCGCGGVSHNPTNGTTVPPTIHGTYCNLLQRIRDSVFDKNVQPQRRQLRRQTPLVNAGYAARIAVMTYVLERWMERVIVPVEANRGYHSNQGINVDVSAPNNGADPKDSCINVVIVGCGVDALGICSKHFLNDLSERKGSDVDDSAITDSNSKILPRVKVYEFDAWENCIIKRNALVKSRLLAESFSFEWRRETSDMQPNARIESVCTISRGRLVLENADDDHDQNNDDDYFLVALDLRETMSIDDDEEEDETNARRKSILSRAIRHVGFDASRPTIVLSELVLAYLGYNGANATISSIAADVLGGNQSSLFVCLEPVFLSEPDTCTIEGGRGVVGCGEQKKLLSVEESYARVYSRQFLETLHRGDFRNATKTKGTTDSTSTCMHPLGSNSRSIKQRLRECGFSSCRICDATLGEAASKVAHLCRKTSNGQSFLCAKEPFDEHAALDLNLSCYGVVCVFSSMSTSNNITEDELENQACDICPWFQKVGHTSSVAVNPIVSLLDDNHVRDLFGRIYEHLYCSYPAIRKMVKSAMKSDLRHEDSDSSCSVIQQRYLSKGGNFWVALDTDKSKMVGCVGLCIRIAKESNVIVEYEIHRLAVDDQYRGMGIGKKLLSIAEQYALQQESDSYPVRSPIRLKMWAVTPNCLTVANKLYESLGYGLEETFQAGSLCMNVYCKPF